VRILSFLSCFAIANPCLCRYLDPEDNTWRCPHVHHFVQAPGHASCVTQIMFPEMPKNEVDNHIRPELTVSLARGPNAWTAEVAFVLLELAKTQ
jgi:protocatechuate 3,4-dioxygenase beta subunit